jgi:predicted nuclease of restriction endonuclease-like RecB superfamily
MKTLPQFLKKYFWDVDFPKLDKEIYTSFIIERILEEGDEKAVRWMRDNFDLDQIKNVLYNSKNLSPRSANYWQLIFNLKREKILCLRKSFQKKQRLIWKY